jgi:holo-[acyl-carrier-protein] synthase
MIYGIGTDIVAITRLQGMWERHGDKTLARLLAPQELGDFARAADKGRFLAKRFGYGRAPACTPAGDSHRSRRTGQAQAGLLRSTG